MQMFRFNAMPQSIRRLLSLSLALVLLPLSLWTTPLTLRVVATNRVAPPSRAEKHLTTSYASKRVMGASVPQATSTVQFSQSSYTVGEGDGRATIAVTRTGDTMGTASVNYATSDTAGLNDCNIFNGIASQRCDYAISVGTLSFAAGETSRVISIPIVDD